MSVKSTIFLTRQQAEDKYFDLFAKINRPQRIWQSDEWLEDMLECMNDEYHGGEGFENYIITDEENESL